MHVTMIRHGKVDMPWVKRYNSKEYDQAWLDYDTYNILPITEHLKIAPDATVIVTGFKRTHQTAEQFLGVHDYIIVKDLLDEIPLRSFMDTQLRIERHILNILGRIQWYLPISRQPERRKASRERAAKFIDMLEKRGDGNYVIVMHGFFLRTLASVFRHRGYKMKNQPFFGVPNLYTAEAIKETL